ncbi:hypothetical protein [Brevundimonas vesicularis]|uniref:hypothetical protein n=1 Tax=Brevundimonas vesicularis TaxID=41276 RepID=UPI00289D1195|nr:hypothetical protein [Brevundimonas vesicularis]
MPRWPNFSAHSGDPSPVTSNSGAAYAEEPSIMKFTIHAIQAENLEGPQEAVIEFDPFDYIDPSEIIRGLLEDENETWGAVTDFEFEIADDGD